MSATCCPRSTSRRWSSIATEARASASSTGGTSRRTSPARRLVELPGIDNLIWAGDQDAIVAEIQDFVTGVRPAPEPQRVLATILFTDIVGSTRLAAELGDERWRALLDEHFRAARRQLERFGGHEVKTTGDGIAGDIRWAGTGDPVRRRHPG